MFNTVATHIVALIFLTCIWLLTPNCIIELYVKFAAFISFLCISYLLASYVDNFLPRFRVKSTNKAVLITGCDTGFGHLLAQRLDSLGFKVFAGCLNPTGNEAKQLKDTTSNKLEIIRLDVTQNQSVQEALRFVEKNLENYELWCIVNNAGIIVRGEAEWMPFEDYKKQFEVNTFGVIRVTQAFLPLLRKFKGRIVTTASVGGRHTFSGFVPYCMSKHATCSFCDGLRLEMAKFDVKVITVEPVSYRTQMTEMSTILKSIEETWSKSSDTLKDIYDRDYIEAFKKATIKFNNQSTLPNMYEVIDCLIEGVCAISPHYSYVPGDLKSKLFLWVSKRIPKTIVDYFVRQYITFDSDLEKFLIKKYEKKEKKHL